MKEYIKLNVEDDFSTLPKIKFTDKQKEYIKDNIVGFDTSNRILYLFDKPFTDKIYTKHGLRGEELLGHPIFHVSNVFIKEESDFNCIYLHEWFTEIKNNI